MLSSPESRRRPALRVLPAVALAFVAFGTFSVYGCGVGDESGGTVSPVSLSVAGETPRTTTTNGPVSMTTLTGSATGASAPTTEASPVSTTQDRASTTTSRVVADPVRALFSHLSLALAPVVVYAPTYLPADASIPAAWWPVMEVAGPGDYHGPELPNPRVDAAEGSPVAAQVVIQIGNGWLAVLENFRGDLGDIEGEVVGEVQGHVAKMYVVNECAVVQWSDAGRWYAVVGRAVPVAEVVTVAVSMQEAVTDVDIP